MNPHSEANPRGALELVRLFMADRGDPDLAAALAERAVASLPDLGGRRVLDLGCGPGLYAEAMGCRGAEVVALELDHAELQRAQGRTARPVLADATSLPFPAGSFDAVVCSNMLEHTPHPLAVLDETRRVLGAGGWAYLSWTNWLSPWGGHAIAPFHYLGAERGERLRRRLFGAPSGSNLPYDGVWPLHIRDVLGHLGAADDVRIESVEPRYYPWARAIMHIPGLREVLAWNCVVRVRKVPTHQRPPTPSA